MNKKGKLPEKLNLEELRRRFDYQDGYLIHKISRLAGEIAGGSYIDLKGYRRIAVDGQRYLEHRLVFAWHYGFFPECVDHIDHNPSNNKIENLRAATKAQNCAHRNEKIYNKTGYRGIKRSPKCWTVEFRKEEITFNVYGHKTKADAAKCYDILQLVFNGKFSGTTNFPKETYKHVFVYPE